MRDLINVDELIDEIKSINDYRHAIIQVLPQYMNLMIRLLIHSMHKYYTNFFRADDDTKEKILNHTDKTYLMYYNGFKNSKSDPLVSITWVERDRCLRYASILYDMWYDTLGLPLYPIDKDLDVTHIIKV